EFIAFLEQGRVGRANLIELRLVHRAIDIQDERAVPSDIQVRQLRRRFLLLFQFEFECHVHPLLTAAFGGTRWRGLSSWVPSRTLPLVGSVIAQQRAETFFTKRLTGIPGLNLAELSG